MIHSYTHSALLVSLASNKINETQLQVLQVLISERGSPSSVIMQQRVNGPKSKLSPCWQLITVDSSGQYIAAVHRDGPVIHIFSVSSGQKLYRFVPFRALEESEVTMAVTSLSFNEASSLLACALQPLPGVKDSKSTVSNGMVAIFQLGSALSSASAFEKVPKGTTREEINCLTSFDFLGIPLPIFNLTFFLGNHSFPWGDSLVESRSASHGREEENGEEKEKVACTPCVGMIPDLGGHPICKFMSGSLAKGRRDKNFLMVVDVEGAEASEFEVLESGRCFRTLKRPLDLTYCIEWDRLLSPSGAERARLSLLLRTS